MARNGRIHKTTISINPFDTKPVNNVISQYIEWEKDIQRKINLVGEKLAEKGIEIAKARIITLGAVFTNELLDSIQYERKSDNVVCIFTDCDHAMYVEFGTGQMGMEGSYPYPFPESVTWEYNIGETIFEFADGQYGWYYPDGQGGWHFTQGMPSRPFMYETAIELTTVIKEIAKGVFNA